MAALSRDLALPILKNCFSTAENIRIVQDQVLEGDRHVTSDITRFVVEYEQDDVTRRKHVVMKVPISSALFSQLEHFNFYDREICVYEKVMPRINGYLRESLAPALLYRTDSKILVLEDLTARGYVSGEKFSLLNFEEAQAAMRTYARFHSTTHKLYEEDPLNLENFLDSALGKVDFMQYVSPWRPVILELLRKKEEHRLLSKVEAAFSYIEEQKDKVLAIIDKSKFKFVALNQGDSRKDNFLFKQTANKEVKAQLIDYQACFICSPAYDISFFLQCSVSANVLEAHFDDLIDGYLHELNMKLKELKCANTYERADFDEDFKKLKFFYFFGLIILCITISSINKKQMQDLMDSAADTSFLYNSCLEDEQFVHSIYGWLKYFEKSNMFNEF